MSHSRNGAVRTLRQIFRVPLLLAVASLAGLFSALLGDGLWDGLSWLFLSAPLVVIGGMLQKSA